MKPMLATNWDKDRLRFPVIAQPKIDGVRGLNMHGALTGRSLKQFRNDHIGDRFSHLFLQGFDGELAAGPETHPDLCRLTTSALNTITGHPVMVWWLFDLVTEETKKLKYIDRYELLQKRVAELQSCSHYARSASYLRVIPSRLVHSIGDLEQVDAQYLTQGFEGTILRDPHGCHKQGRSTVREGGLLRIKRFIDAEAIVIGLLEGRTNQNETQINELGHQFRSSHEENMQPNGLVGALTCRILKDTPGLGAVILQQGQIVTVSPGNMDHALRKYYFENPSEIVAKVIKFKFFPKGIKDKPRFPTFVSIREPEDM